MGMFWRSFWMSCDFYPGSKQAYVSPPLRPWQTKCRFVTFSKVMSVVIALCIPWPRGVNWMQSASRSVNFTQWREIHQRQGSFCSETGESNLFLSFSYSKQPCCWPTILWRARCCHGNRSCFLRLLYTIRDRRLVRTEEFISDTEKTASLNECKSFGSRT